MDTSKHLEKAAEAVRKKNFDYAISLYHQVLKLRPDHGEARRELRQALVRRHEYKKAPAALSLLQGLPNRVGVGFGKALKKPAQVIDAAERFLKNDPRNSRVNMALAEALESAGHANSAVAVWEFLGDHEEVGDYALKRAGAIYYALKDMEKALGCYEAVLKRAPRDSEAEKMRKNLAAEGVLSSGSYDPTRSSRELARDQGRKKELEVEQKIVTTEDERTLLRNKLVAALEENPTDKRARRALVDHDIKAKEYDRAAAVLDEGVALDPESFELRERLGDVRVLSLEQQLRMARKLANKGDVAAATDVIDLEREIVEFQTEEFGRRAKEHPTDLEVRFRLGNLLLQSERYDAAVEAFQASVKDPRRRVDSLLGLGRAFEGKGLADLARKQYDQALAAVDDGSERATDIIYSIACLLDSSGDLGGARERFESIYERDIHYRDVAERLAAIRARSAAGPAPVAQPAQPQPAVSPKVEDPVAKEPPASTTEAKDESPGDSASGESGDEGSPGIYDFKD